MADKIQIQHLVVEKDNGSQNDAEFILYHRQIMGENTTALYDSAHAEGQNTQALGKGSHAEGFGTIASYSYSHAGGLGTITGAQGQTVFGKYNRGRSDTVFEIGAGTTDKSPKNAFEVYMDGRVKVLTEPKEDDDVVRKIDLANYAPADDGKGMAHLQDSETVGAIQQLQNQESGVTPGYFSFMNGDKTKNPNATALDSNLKGEILYGGRGQYSTALGGKSAAIGKRSVAEGTTTIAKGNYSHAEGDNSVTLGVDSHAEGYATVTGPDAQAGHAEGINTQALGKASHAEGQDTIAYGQDSHAEGSNTATVLKNEQGNVISIGEAAHAEGGYTKAAGKYSHTEGYMSQASAEAAHAEGKNTTASEIGAHSEGNATEASGQYAHAEGNDTHATESHAHAEGKSTTAKGTNAHAEGDTTTAEGVSSHAGGTGAHAKGSYSFAHGNKVVARYANQFIVGKFNSNKEGTLFEIGNGADTDHRSNVFEVYNNGLVVVGDRVQLLPRPDKIHDTNGKKCFTISKTVADKAGISTEVEYGSIGDYTATLNGRNSAQSKHATAIGNSTVAIGEESLAGGYQSVTLGNGSFAFGDGNVTKGLNCQAMGVKTQAIGDASHATGSATIATGYASQAGGYESQANGYYSFAHGVGLIAGHTYQAVFGKWNENSSDNLFEIGNGDSAQLRSNAFEVSKDGNVRAYAAPIFDEDVLRYADAKSHDIYQHTLKLSKSGGEPIYVLCYRDTKITTFGQLHSLFNSGKCIRIFGPSWSALVSGNVINIVSNTSNGYTIYFITNGGQFTGLNVGGSASISEIESDDVVRVSWE